MQLTTYRLKKCSNRKYREGKGGKEKLMSHGLARHLYFFLGLGFSIVSLINGMSLNVSPFGYRISQQVHFMSLPPTFPVDFFNMSEWQISSLGQPYRELIVSNQCHCPAGPLSKGPLECRVISKPMLNKDVIWGLKIRLQVTGKSHVMIRVNIHHHLLGWLETKILNILNISHGLLIFSASSLKLALLSVSTM